MGGRQKGGVTPKTCTSYPALHTPSACLHLQTAPSMWGQTNSPTVTILEEPRALRDSSLTSQRTVAPPFISTVKSRSHVSDMLWDCGRVPTKLCQQAFSLPSLTGASFVLLVEPSQRDSWCPGDKVGGDIAFQISEACENKGTREELRRLSISMKPDIKRENKMPCISCRPFYLLLRGEHRMVVLPRT